MKFIKYINVFFISVFFVCCSVSQSFAKVINVLPDGKIQKGLDNAINFSDINWFEIYPGDTILLQGGSYDELFTIFAKGTLNEPVIIKAAKGQTPVFNASVLFTHAAHVILDGVTVTKSPYPGIIIREESNHITVINNTIYNNGLGVWIAEQGGMDNKITKNRVFKNKTHGIAVDKVNCTPGHETIISDNTVYENGHHGIEITGNYYIIENNNVYKNGTLTGGASGIHLFVRNANEDTGKYNIIRYNISHHNNDKTLYDGNGIQADQWCDYNQIYYNISYGNDGAGIAVFDSSNNTIHNNTLYNNMQDPGNSHIYNAEIVLASDYTKNVDHVNNITLVNNIIVANKKSTYAIYVDHLTHKNNLSIGNNIFFNTKGGNLYFWDSKKGKDIKIWNQLAKGMGDDFYKNPMFEKENPLKQDDFKIKKDSFAIDRSVYLNQTRDIKGIKIHTNKIADIGAIEGN